jgi:arsenite methyltransferase
VIYKGPWKSVQDDDGHTLLRGDRMAVCDKTFKLYTDPTGPYRDDMIAIAPYSEVPYDEAPNFDCSRDVLRSPRHTKGLDYRETIAQSENCC